MEGEDNEVAHPRILGVPGDIGFGVLGDRVYSFCPVTPDVFRVHNYIGKLAYEAFCVYHKSPRQSQKEQLAVQGHMTRHHLSRPSTIAQECCPEEMRMWRRQLLDQEWSSLTEASTAQILWSSMFVELFFLYNTHPNKVTEYGTLFADGRPMRTLSDYRLYSR